GGVLKAIDLGFFQQEIADAAFEFQRKIEKKRRTVIGVNKHVIPNEKIAIDLLKIDPEVDRIQRERLGRVRADRSPEEVKKALDGLRRAARDGSNTMPHFLNCARTYATLGETLGVLREEFGEYKEPPIF
ncbi:MAG: methylmalonyl-CoA mutase family protein, partial [bacterium]|nr:methylmalonyl-CoA mutase family protein [bacterium]